MLNLRSCYSIIRLHRSSDQEDQITLRDQMRVVVIKETMQILIPTIFGIILCMSHFGPNAEMLGSHIIEDITVPLRKIAFLLLIDIMLLLFSSLILWRHCKLLLIQKYFWMMETYWKTIAFQISGDAKDLRYFEIPGI